MEETNPTHFQNIVSHAATWSFADDFALLQWIRHISHSLQTRVRQTKSNLNDLSSNVNCTNIALDNVANGLTALQFGKQFVENRVQDDDEVTSAFVEHKNELDCSNAKSSHTIFDVFLGNNMKILRKFGNITSISHLNLNEENDISYNPLINPYNARSLPHIIYSKEWKEDTHAGILPRKSTNQIDIDISDTFSKSTISSNGDSTEDDFFVCDRSPSITQNRQLDDNDDSKVPEEASRGVKSKLNYSVSDIQKYENISKGNNGSTNSLLLVRTNDNPSPKSPITVSNIKIRPTNLFDDNDFQSFINELSVKVQLKESNNNITEKIKQKPPEMKPSKDVDVFANSLDKLSRQSLTSLSLFDESDDKDDDFFKSLTKNINQNDSNISKIRKTVEGRDLKILSNDRPSHELPSSTIENKQLDFSNISIVDHTIQKAHETISKLLQNEENSEDEENNKKSSIRFQSETKSESRIPSKGNQKQTYEPFVTNNKRNEGNEFNIQANDVLESDPIEYQNTVSNHNYKYIPMENNFHIFSNEPPDDNDFFDSMDKSTEIANYVLENEPFYESDSLPYALNQRSPPNVPLTQDNMHYSENIFYDDFSETLLALQQPSAVLTSIDANYYSVNNEPPKIDDKYNTTSSNINKFEPPMNALISPNFLRNINLEQHLVANISNQADAIQSTSEQDSNIKSIFPDNINRTYILPNVNKNRVRPSALRKPPSKRLISQFKSNSENKNNFPILKTPENIDSNTANSSTDKQNAIIREEIVVCSEKPISTDNIYHPLMQPDEDPIKISLNKKLIAAFDSDDSDDFDDLFPKKPASTSTSLSSFQNDF